ncbi:MULTISPECIES: NAD(P)H-dependent glycerol-3-phosphate dehydrogenase [Allobranchiibius]|uniref:Glycerol-3-phosphate dehydrogenase [NAD(P)+] n=1 Tax=Allobranchiibius huperziae TaxID=1874116 RepID=A0A853DGR4_9MICO|nr:MULTISPECIES: NAD(P)H-dependent glycerol-3-phosphate dehydrogenase [Allobranchiibius]MBO1765611.1 NAD(P)-dependent glycerol-3-phosphate dehydrogenase [Allobranchiibius sp. GilTou38]NYJ74041.1 glycerol-3-phosphate dehydrogenase (NAD(P)+) [Allobranchiibius huperziae]UIJ34552.1 NAD(P)-dependent glycerol-3-phosphate dehydrogenase [Allobranchiibius sp. GilTou73]
MSRVTVLGSGSWGTAFSAVLADAGNDVTMWARRAEVAQEIRETRVNAAYLPDLKLSERIRVTDDAHEAMQGAEIVAIAVPAQSLRDNLADWRSAIPGDAAVVSLMKGIELGTTMRMSEVICEAGGVDSDRVVVVSGPNLALEIAAKQPAAALVASTSARMRARVAEACASRYFRPYLGKDVVGTELAGATKNVVALAVGMASGMGMGENTMASLLTRGLAETARLGTALTADPATFLGLAGVGDLVATCTSPKSRNRTFGFELGSGKSLEEVVAHTRQTAEGVKSCRSILELARSVEVDVPIVENVAAVVHEGRTPGEVVESLMSRSRKDEKA